MKPEISIIIPTHKRVEFLKRALASVLKQTYANFECIVISDCPDEFEVV